MVLVNFWPFFWPFFAHIRFLSPKHLKMYPLEFYRCSPEHLRQFSDVNFCLKTDYTLRVAHRRPPEGPNWVKSGQKWPKKAKNGQNVKCLQKPSVAHQNAHIFGTELTHEVCFKLNRYQMVQMGQKWDRNGTEMGQKQFRCLTYPKIKFGTSNCIYF